MSKTEETSVDRLKRDVATTTEQLKNNPNLIVIGARERIMKEVEEKMISDLIEEAYGVDATDVANKVSKKGWFKRVFSAMVA